MIGPDPRFTLSQEHTGSPLDRVVALIFDLQVPPACREQIEIAFGHLPRHLRDLPIDHVDPVAPLPIGALSVALDAAERSGAAPVTLDPVGQIVAAQFADLGSP